MPLCDAVCQVFDEWFWDDCLKIDGETRGWMPDLSASDRHWSHATFMQTAPTQLDPSVFDSEAHAAQTYP